MPEPKGDEVFELSDLEIETVGLVGKAANRRKYLLFKRDKTEENMPEETTETPIVNIDGVVEQLQGAEDVGGLKKAFDAFLGLFRGTIEKADPPVVEPDPEPEPAPASTPDPAIVELQSVTKALQGELEKAQSRAEEAGRIAEEERDRRVVQEYVVKAEGLAVPGKPEELASLLKWADEQDADKGKAILDALTAASEAIVQSGIFVEKGTTRIDERTDPFLTAVEKKQAELRTADPTLSREAAFAKAYTVVGNEQPELARRHIAERQAATGRK
jgi:hypothetical protein